MSSFTEIPEKSDATPGPVRGSGEECRFASSDPIEREFNAPWPGFLIQLDDDADDAFESFYLFAREMFRTQAPRLLRRIPTTQREDVLHDVVYHCCKDDFKVLRMYENRGMPFARWLKCVANRKIIDRLKRRERTEAMEEPGDISQYIVRDPHRSDVRAEAADTLETALKRLEEMDEECQLLILAKASGMKPREITKLLGWPQDHNHKASDKCRYVLGRLKANAQ